MGAYAREEIEAIYRRQFKLVYQICLVLMKIGRASCRERV